MSNSPTVPIFDSKGELWDIPYEKMHDALSAGGKIGVNVISPEGKNWIIPADKAAQALAVPGAKKGASILSSQENSWAPPAEETPKPSGSAVPNARIRNLPNPAEGMTPGEAAISGMSTGLTAATLPMFVEAPVESILSKSLAPLYPLARGILGSMAGKYAGTKAGAVVGHPELGGNIGAIAGGLYAGAGGKIPGKTDIMEFFNKPEFRETGAPLPSAEEFYANHGAEIMKAMKQQPEAFGIPAPPEGAPLPDVAKFYEMRGREIMAAMKQQPEAFGFDKGQFAKTSNPRIIEEGNPQDLISRTRRIVKPGEEPSAEDLKRAGDLTQAPLPRLKLLASWGDRLAQNEINRRLKNP